MQKYKTQKRIPAGEYTAQLVDSKAFFSRVTCKPGTRFIYIVHTPQGMFENHLLLPEGLVRDIKLQLKEFDVTLPDFIFFYKKQHYQVTITQNNILDYKCVWAAIHKYLDTLE